MEDTHNGLHGVLAQQLVEMEPTPEHAHAQLQFPNSLEETVSNKILDLLLKQRLASLDDAQVCQQKYFDNMFSVVYCSIKWWLGVFDRVKRTNF